MSGYALSHVSLSIYWLKIEEGFWHSTGKSSNCKVSKDMKRTLSDTQQTVLGFGFVPEQAHHHFLVSIPMDKTAPVSVSEHFEWTGTIACVSDDDPALRIILDRSHWNAIADPLRASFNVRLRNGALPVGRWQPGHIPLVHTFGKELLMLAWGIEDLDLVYIPDAIARWQRFAPEERWWLATMTMASKRGQGWRAALRHILTDGLETVQISPVIT